MDRKLVLVLYFVVSTSNLPGGRGMGEGGQTAKYKDASSDG